jgi:hypothetical protein
MWALAAAAAAAYALTATSSNAGGGCPSTYAYAGLAHGSSAYGVQATLTAVSRPRVRWGHVAGWVGVGGRGMGANGSDAWIQVGFSGFYGGDSALYYEVARPGHAPYYTEIDGRVEPGETHRVAVVEVPGHHDWWRVHVDGRIVGTPVHLPGSHSRWTPMAVAESWNAGRATCNGFEYRFQRVLVRQGGEWRVMAPGTIFQDQGYRFLRRPTGFVATGA